MGWGHLFIRVVERERVREGGRGGPAVVINNWPVRRGG